MTHVGTQQDGDCIARPPRPPLWIKQQLRAGGAPKTVGLEVHWCMSNTKLAMLGFVCSFSVGALGDDKTATKLELAFSG